MLEIFEDQKGGRRRGRKRRKKKGKERKRKQFHILSILH
jgi:hypothetical protein